MEQRWIVVLEVVENQDAPIGLHELDRLLVSLDGVEPTALHGRDRYLLQLQVAAHNCRDALDEALSYWNKALTAAGIPNSDVVRVEVLTHGEFQRECQSSDRRTTYSNLLRDAVRRHSER